MIELTPSREPEGIELLIKASALAEFNKLGADADPRAIVQVAKKISGPTEWHVEKFLSGYNEAREANGLEPISFREYTG